MGRVLLLLACATVVLGQGPASYSVSTLAGRGKFPYPGDGFAATTVPLFDPFRVAFDNAGILYFTETYYRRVLRVSQDGILSTVAADIDALRGITVSSTGVVFVGRPGRIVRIDTDGAVVTIAGSGEQGYRDDIAANARLGEPTALLDSKDGLYFADSSNHAIRVLSAGSVLTVAGTGAAGFSGDGGPAQSARLNQPQGIALDAEGRLYIADHENNRIRRLSNESAFAARTITTFAGTGEWGSTGDGGHALQAQLASPAGLAVTNAGLYLAEENTGRVRRIGPTGQINAVVTLPSAYDLAAGPGYLAVTDYLQRTIRRITPDGASTLLAGLLSATALGDGRAAKDAVFLTPRAMVVDLAGNLFIADMTDQRVRRVDRAGIITTFAGSGIFGLSGDLGPATNANIAQPVGLAMDSSGSLYLTANNRIRRVTINGVISSFVGGNNVGYSGDNGPALNARINFPDGLAVDSQDRLVIADTFNHRVRRVDRAGIITTIAGTGDFGYLGGGGPATTARLNEPRAVAVDSTGNIYIADSRNNRVRKLPPDGTLHDFAGTGEQGNDGDGGPALRARLDFPSAVAVDAAGNVYFASGAQLRRVSPDGIISRVGSDVVMVPSGLTLDPDGRLYVADDSGKRILRFDPVQIVSAGVLHGATFLPGPVAPGEILALFGSDLGPAQLQLGSFDAQGKLCTRLAETEITFDSVPAPLLYVSARQAGPIVPYSVAGKTSTVMQVTYRGRKTNTVALPVSDSSPGLVTVAGSGRGQAAAINQDGTLNSAASPADRGSVLVLYATGEGQTSPGGTDGLCANSALPRPALPVSVTFDDIEGEVLYAGAAPGMTAGAMQVNVRVPPTAPAGAGISLRLQVGPNISPRSVTVALR